MRARGGDLTAKSISSVGGLIEYLCSGVGTFDCRAPFIKIVYLSSHCLHSFSLSIQHDDDVHDTSCCLIREIG